jgi:ParB family chromosome partitioning protein
VAVAPARSDSGSQLVDIDLIEPSPFQPRSRFPDEALAELAQSISANGIIQPLVLRRAGARFQLLAGERRWRAAQRIGLARVPAIVREVSDSVALEISLVENIQREDLNPVEQARAFERLMSDFHMTQEDVAARTGKDRATIANSVRLLRLDKSILDLIENGKLSAGHGRALLAIADGGQRLALARRAARGGITVRHIERFAARRPRSAAPSMAAERDPNTRSALEQLQQALGTRVTLRPPSKNKPGELAIEYYDDAQLDGFYQRLMS